MVCDWRGPPHLCRWREAFGPCPRDACAAGRRTGPSGHGRSPLATAVNCADGSYCPTGTRGSCAATRSRVERQARPCLPHHAAVYALVGRNTPGVVRRCRYDRDTTSPKGTVMASALIVVDTQNGFLRMGNLASDRCLQALPAIQREVDLALEAGGRGVFTADTPP